MENEAIELENKISTLIYEDNKCTVHFDFSYDQDSRYSSVDLTVLTYNPIHKRSFLLGQFSAKSKLLALKEVLRYLEENSIKQVKNSYSVLWKKNSESEMKTSYFTGRDMREVLEKFYYKEDDKKHPIVFECKLNPIA